MEEVRSPFALDAASGPSRLAAEPAPYGGDDWLLPTQEIERALGQSIQEALDLRAWADHGGLERVLERIGQFAGATVQADSHLRQAIREHALSRLEWFTDAPADAGVYRIDARHLQDARRNHLLPGAVTAVHGACTGHEGLSASVVAIGVGSVCYDGEQRSWRTTFLRHDYDFADACSLDEVRRFLNREARNERVEGADRDRLTYLLRRGFMAAAERKALLEKSASPWRMGRGVPAPLELLTGAGSTALLDHVLPILERLLLQHQRWVFLPTTESHAALRAMADALLPGQLAIFVKGKVSLENILERGHFAPGYRQRVLQFASELGEQMVLGGFRATDFAPAQLFAAHARHALLAGAIVMADAQSQPHRGTPLLLDLAGESARVGLGIDAFQGIVESAYAREETRKRTREAAEQMRTEP